ncbi:hypothetical protein BO85DRAFT_267277 [Aspergillus piperis CBS 112811]|uniref:Uncharacterized protein n=1 Tax=Aspergillus piperis CBS 112811 TaxID=1448313 RepID=A0A8G1VMW1_9EURO|nr:hypothetical protein BO85DRAFT_267277 [Aspergillus piperis CBS 112811]RAH59269.1 hypothetical protein BO85DRAFT_267277 [Aspergillus piperis CBS 112811]
MLQVLTIRDGYLGFSCCGDMIPVGFYTQRIPITMFSCLMCSAPDLWLLWGVVYMSCVPACGSVVFMLSMSLALSLSPPARLFIVRVA